MKTIKIFRRCLHLALWCVLPGLSRAQDSTSATSKIYFKSARGPYWNKEQLDSFLQSKDNNRYKLVTRLTGREERNDSLVYRIDIILDPAPADRNNQPLAGQELPPFEFHDLAGKSITSASLKGHPAVINLWFTSCAPCISEMRALNALHDQYKNSGVAFLAITFDKRSTVIQFLKKHFFNFTVVPDAVGYCYRMTSIYPVTLFVDSNGIIRYAEHLIPSSRDPVSSLGTGYLDISTFEKDIDAIRGQ